MQFVIFQIRSLERKVSSLEGDLVNSQRELWAKQSEYKKVRIVFCLCHQVLLFLLPGVTVHLVSLCYQVSLFVPPGVTTLYHQVSLFYMNNVQVENGPLSHNIIKII